MISLSSFAVLLCDLGGILTPNRWSRNPVLYTVELRSRMNKNRKKIMYFKLIPIFIFAKVITLFQKRFIPI